MEWGGCRSPTPLPWLLTVVLEFAQRPYFNAELPDSPEGVATSQISFHFSQGGKEEPSKLPGRFPRWVLLYRLPVGQAAPSSPSPSPEEGTLLGSTPREATQGRGRLVQAEGLAGGGCPPRAYNQGCPPHGRWMCQLGPGVQLPGRGESGAPSQSPTRTEPRDWSSGTGSPKLETQDRVAQTDWGGKG